VRTFSRERGGRRGVDGTLWPSAGRLRQVICSRLQQLSSARRSRWKSSETLPWKTGQGRGERREIIHANRYCRSAAFGAIHTYTRHRFGGRGGTAPSYSAVKRDFGSAGRRGARRLGQNEIGKTSRGRGLRKRSPCEGQAQAARDARSVHPPRARSHAWPLALERDNRQHTTEDRNFELRKGF
jgi:hypothetical protein